MALLQVTAAVEQAYPVHRVAAAVEPDPAVRMVSGVVGWEDCWTR